MSQMNNSVMFSLESLPDFNGGSVMPNSGGNVLPQYVVQTQRQPMQREYRGVTPSHMTHKLRNLATMPTSRETRVRAHPLGSENSFEAS